MGATFGQEADAALNTKAARGGKRALLAILTAGTSEIKTGAGEYGDETVADALFPKEINNLLLSDRQDARKAADAAKAAELAKYQPGPPPDLASQLTAAAAGSSKLRMAAKSGRRSTFLSGGQ